MTKVSLTIISVLGLLAFISVCVVGVLFVAKKLFRLDLFDRLRKLLHPYAYQLAFVAASMATLASLFLSEVLHFPPCILCWYQRIAMYPQVVLLYVAQLRNERVLTPYLMVLNAVGGLIALYHYSLHVLPRTLVPILPCAKQYAGVPCDKGYDLYFGFMTFPLMAWAVFMVIIILLSFASPVPSRGRAKKR